MTEEHIAPAPSPRWRTAAVTLLAVVVAVRASAGGPLRDAATVIAADPAVALDNALAGWRVEGSLGVASAQGMRELPLSAAYWLAEQLSVQIHAAQIAWRAVVLVIAVIGAVRLARLCAQEADSWAPWAAAVAFGCGPLMVTTVVADPLDGFAIAAMPWVLAPLVGTRRGWRAAAASAAWLAAVGVADPLWAASVLAAGAVAALPRDWPSVAQLARWLLLALPASAWWMVAAWWEYRHGPELSGLAPSRPVDVLFGTAVGWPDMALPPLVLVAGGPVLVAGYALALRVHGARRVVVGGLLLLSGLVGVLVLTGAWVPPVRTIDVGDRFSDALGPLLALVWLAGLVAWTPLVAHLRPRLRSPMVSDPLVALRRLAVIGMCVGLCVPLLVGLVVAAQERSEDLDPLPSVWADVAAWSRTAAPGRVLVLPAVADPADQVVVARALTGRAWVSRDPVPSSGSAATTAIDDLIGRLGRGQTGPGTRAALERLGISYVLLRGDLPLHVDRARPGSLVRAALADQRTATRSFVGVDPSADTQAAPGSTVASVVDFGLRSPVEQVEVWHVGRSASAWTYPGPPVDVVGDVAAVGDLADAGLLGGEATRVRPAAAGDDELVSDSARRRDIDLRVPGDPYGPALEADEPRIVVPPDAGPGQTAVAQWVGARSVEASSSAADLASEWRKADAVPGAAVDGNVFSAWQSRRGSASGEWWQIAFGGAVDLSEATVSFIDSRFVGPRVTSVRLETDQETVDREVLPGGQLFLDLDSPATRLRITVTSVDGRVGPDQSVGIGELSAPGLDVTEQLALRESAAAAWVLATRPGSQGHCLPAVASPTGRRADAVLTVCSAGVSVPGPEARSLERVITVRSATPVTGVVWLRAPATESTAALADRLASPTVVATASSAVQGDLVARPQAAVDDDPMTSWRPAVSDAEPTLTLRWEGPAPVSGLRLTTADESVSSIPTRVRVEAGEVAMSLPVVRGTVSFPALQVDELTITVTEDSGLTSIDSRTSGLTSVPVAISEVEIVGGPAVRYDADAVTDLGCVGPAADVAGTVVPTAVTVSARQLVEGAVVPAPTCGPVELEAGEVRVRVPASFSWTPLGMVLSRRDGPFGAVDRPSSWAGPEDAASIGSPPDGHRATSRTVSTEDATARGEAVLALTSPAGAGWRARAGDQELTQLTVDGWAQGWAVPEGVERVAVDYEPGSDLRIETGIGALAAIGVLVVAVAGRLAAGRSSAGRSRSRRSSLVSAWAAASRTGTSGRSGSSSRSRTSPG